MASLHLGVIILDWTEESRWLSFVCFTESDKCKTNTGGRGVAGICCQGNASVCFYIYTIKSTCYCSQPLMVPTQTAIQYTNLHIEATCSMWPAFDGPDTNYHTIYKPAHWGHLFNVASLWWSRHILPYNIQTCTLRPPVQCGQPLMVSTHTTIQYTNLHIEATCSMWPAFDGPDTNYHTIYKPAHWGHLFNVASLWWSRHKLPYNIQTCTLRPPVQCGQPLMVPTQTTIQYTNLHIEATCSMWPAFDGPDTNYHTIYKPAHWGHLFNVASLWWSRHKLPYNIQTCTLRPPVQCGQPVMVPTQTAIQYKNLHIEATCSMWPACDGPDTNCHTIYKPAHWGRLFNVASLWWSRHKLPYNVQTCTLRPPVQCGQPVMVPTQTAIQCTNLHIEATCSMWPAFDVPHTNCHTITQPAHWGHLSFVTT